MSRYPAASEIFPYYLKGSRRIVAILTKDGLVTVHYPAERDSFEFRVSSEQSVTDLTEELAVQYPNGYKYDPSPAPLRTLRRISTGRSKP